MSRVDEIALAFSCEGSQLIGVFHAANNEEKIGVVVVVGGPQTRVGSHRQFVQLARMLAENDIPSLRFDYRGMGDSDGPLCGFEQVSDDIRAAVDTLQEQSGVERVVLWGLCDAVPAITAYANTDKRIVGVTLLNPWVRTSSGVARTYMRTHYTKQILSAEFWAKTCRGDVNIIESVRSFIDTFYRAIYPRNANKLASQVELSLPDRMIANIECFNGAVLLIVSGNDMTAQEFRNTVEVSSSWRKILDRGCIMRRELTEADHTFSNRVWGKQVEAWTVKWVRML